MDKTTKLIYRFHNLLIIMLMLVLLTGGIYWIISGITARRHQKQIEAVKPIINQQLALTNKDIVRTCVYQYDEQSIIVSVNHQDYFIVKNNQLKVYDAINSQTKEKYPDLPVDDEYIDLYWVLENCR